jgi:hypothetical protein
MVRMEETRYAYRIFRRQTWWKKIGWRRLLSSEIWYYVVWYSHIFGGTFCLQPQGTGDTSTLRTEKACFSEMSSNFYQTIQCHSPGNNKLYNDHHKNLKFHRKISYVEGGWTWLSQTIPALVSAKLNLQVLLPECWS